MESKAELSLDIPVEISRKIKSLRNDIHRKSCIQKADFAKVFEFCVSCFSSVLMLFVSEIFHRQPEECRVGGQLSG